MFPIVSKNLSSNVIPSITKFFIKSYAFCNKPCSFLFSSSNSDTRCVNAKQFKFDEADALQRCLDLNDDNDFVDEIEYIVKYHYEHDYKITNLKIHEHLKFSQFEINMFRCAYTEERQAIDKKKRLKRLSDKRKQERNVKTTKEIQFDVVKNNPDMTRQELADILGVSIRTISNIKKQLKSA